jgi:pseudaminic acid cytidylyltransferase
LRVAIVPARSGSKRIKNKNIVDFFGKPMLGFCIDKLIQSNLFDKVYVSTDSSEYADLARKYGAEVPFLRSAQFSDDFTGTVPVISNFLSILTSVSSEDLVCCVYPTTPLMQISHIEECLSILNDEADYVFPVAQYSYPIERSFQINNNNNLKMLFPDNIEARSQDLKTFFHDAGQFYWAKSSTWLNCTPMLSEKSKVLKIDNKYVQDIDTLEDLEMAKIKYRIMEELY